MITRVISLGCLLFCVGGLWAYGVIGTRVTPFEARIIQATDTPRPGTVRQILIVGTSLTSRGTWVAELEAELQACAHDVTVERLARAGASSRWGLSAFRDAVAAGQGPYDVIIVEFLANDGALWNGMPLSFSRNRHTTMIARMRATGASVVLTTMSPAWGWNGWGERPGHRRYFGMYRDLATELRAGLIDTIPEWRALSNTDRQALVPDDLHPSPAAMRLITIPAFLELLVPLVCD